MKRFILISVFLLMVTVSGCTVINDDSSKFRLAMTNYDETKTFGYYFQSTQTIDDKKGNERIITQKIDWENGKAYTEVFERSILEFNSESVYSESSHTTYYYDGQIGFQVEDGEVSWQIGSLEAYIDNKLPIRTIYSSYLEPGYLIEESESGLTLTGTLIDPSKIIKDDENIQRIDIKIGITLEGLLAFIKIEIVYPNSELWIDYQVYYEKQTVIIP